MKNLTKILSLLLALTMLLCFPVAVSAAELEDAPIDESRTGSLTIYKYDLTNAEKDGVWDSSYVSTGVFDQTGVNDVLGGSGAALGNGETGYGYAIKGVEFSYIKVADIVQFSESENDSRTDSHVEVLYAIDKTKGADFLKALNLADGKDRYTNADTLDSTKYYYQSDVLIDALAAALESNSTVVKNALESYIPANGGAAMPLTDSYGKTKAENLDLGLYLVVETKVPEMVVSTTDPFLVSVPMTSVNGTNATDGGTRWIYDITLYPKNLTGIPSLEKTLRENKNDTGKHQGSASSITDGYAHTGTASAGDTIDYQIISTLPAITSESTYLSCYTFVDTLSKGLTYDKGDVVLEFFTDATCTDSVAKWTEADGKFSVAYNTTDAGESVMTIEMTADGLTEINTSMAVYSGASMVNSGYSDCTLRITYAAKMDSSSDLVFGDKGNDNKVVLTWKRSSQNYYDTLVDDCHVFSYGIDLTKLFSDGQGDFSKVEFLIQNKTDNYFVKAELNKTDGVYYVVDHVTDKADATHFVPVKTADAQGRIIVKGLEDDTYTLTEVRTDSGYVMLKQGIDVVISQKNTNASCGIYGTDVLGLIQNDPRYQNLAPKDINAVQQKYLEHKLLTASAAVDGKKVTMLEDTGSVNAEAPLTVVNTRGFDLPKTGDNGTMMFTVVGILLMAGAVSVIALVSRRSALSDFICPGGSFLRGLFKGGFHTNQKRITIALAVMAFLLALGLTLYPVISNYVNQKYASQIHTAYQEVMEQVDDSDFRKAKELANEYNRALVPGATDAYSQEGLQAASADYGSQLNLAGNGIMGYVEIPKISVNLPVYHGTENDSLEGGIGHLLGSSLPIGGESTHSILSGHSGMASQKMFTDLEQLIIGDVFYLHVLDETLAYQVVEINTVLPYDTSLLGIAPGEDLCTLVTCTPYGVNTHRLLVRGSRIPYAEAELLVEETAEEEPAKSTWEQKYIEGLLWGVAAVLLLLLLIGVGVYIYQNFSGGGRYEKG